MLLSQYTVYPENYLKPPNLVGLGLAPAVMTVVIRSYSGSKPPHYQILHTMHTLRAKVCTTPEGAGL